MIYILIGLIVGLTAQNMYIDFKRRRHARLPPIVEVVSCTETEDVVTSPDSDSVIATGLNDVEPEQSSYEIALEETESGQMDSAVWAKAYAHTETEDGAKRYYVRERAKILDKDNGVGQVNDDNCTEQINDELTPVREETKDKQIRRLGILGWICILFVLGLTLSLDIGAFSFVHEAIPPVGEYDPTVVVFWGLVSLFVRIILLVVTFKLVTGFSFGYFPEDKNLRPRSFFAIWLGLIIYGLFVTLILLTLHSYDPIILPMAQIIDPMIISIGTFIICFVVGLMLSGLYKIVVR
mgnify:CR=1 FL=1